MRRSGRTAALVAVMLVSALAIWTTVRDERRSVSDEARPASHLSKVPSTVLTAERPQRNYAFKSLNESTAVSTNKDGQFETRVSPDGVAISPIRANSPHPPAWSVKLNLESISRAGKGAPTGYHGESVSSANARASIHRGPVTEWYENTEEGLEQGFTLHERPDGQGELRLRVAVDGVQARAWKEDELLLTKDGVGVLSYSHLVVSDADGKRLPAHMEAQGSSIVLAANDDDAAYPVTVDPVIGPFPWQSYGQTVAGAEFGNAVELVGDVNGDGYIDAVVGAPGFDTANTDAGAAYLFIGSAFGLVIEPTQTFHGDDEASARFGQSLVGIGDINQDGFDDVLVGAPGLATSPTYGGKVLLYYGSSTGLSVSPTWTHAETQAGAQYGFSLASVGDTDGDGATEVIVGAPYWDATGAQDSGKAVLHEASGGGLGAIWTAEGAPTAQAGAHFGYAVAGLASVNGPDPDTNTYADVAVGAPDHDETSPDSGRVAVFLGSSTGLSVTAAWTHSGGDVESARFGAALAPAGDLDSDGKEDLLVGSPGYQNVGDSVFTDHGRASGFVQWGASGFAATPVWEEIGTSNGRLGTSLRAVGDINNDGYHDVAVGIPGRSVGTKASTGMVNIYAGDGNGVGTLLFARNPPGQVGSEFGTAISGGSDLDGDARSDFLAGAPYRDATNGSNTAVDVGYARVILGNTDQYFLYGSMAAADLNGDGYDDLVVGAHYYDDGGASTGRAWWYMGSASGLSVQSAGATSGDTEVGAWFGYNLISAGDVNGDGRDDVLISAPRQNPYNGGAIHLYHGSAEGLGERAWIYGYSETVQGWLGAWLLNTGDLNGDGLLDIAAGIKEAPGCTDSGKVLIFLGTPSGFGSSPDQEVIASGCEHTYAWRGDVLKDVNGDGYDELAIGAYSADTTTGGTDSGFVDIHYGGPTGVSTTADIRLERPGTGLTDYGKGVRSAGDMDSDGYGDLVVLGLTPYDTSTGVGKGYFFRGSASGLIQTPQELLGSPISASTSYNLGGLGLSLAPTDDINGDGYSDFVIGAWKQRRAYIFTGSPTGANSKWAWSAYQHSDNTNYFGNHIAVGRDFNGDGHPDLAIGANRASAWEGLVYIYMGRGTGELFEYADTSEDLCTDTDLDDICYTTDNCPIAYNPGQEDADSDGIGDPCEDADGDGIADVADACQAGETGWTSTALTDHDADGCRDSTEDTDDDNDGVLDPSDTCPFGDVGWTSPPSVDTDGDGCRDSEDTDDDNDGVADPFDPLPLSAGSCGDQDGDACDDCWSVAQCYGECDASGATGLHGLFKASAPTQDPFVTSVAGGYAFRIEGLYDGNAAHAVTLTLEDDAFLSTDSAANEAYLAGRAQVTDLGGGPGTLGEIWTLTMPFTIIGQGDSASGTAGPTEEMLPGFQPAFITDTWHYLEVGEATLRSPTTDDVVLLTPAPTDPRPQLGPAASGVNLACGLNHQFDFQRNNSDGSTVTGTGELRIELARVEGGTL